LKRNFSLLQKEGVKGTVCPQRKLQWFWSQGRSQIYLHPLSGEEKEKKTRIVGKKFLSGSIQTHSRHCPKKKRECPLSHSTGESEF